MSRLLGNKKVNYKPKDDYYTPQWIFQALNIKFDLDVAAPLGGVPWLPTENHYSIEDNGLVQNWYGKVWMNPPYSETTPWVNKFIEHKNGIALLPFTKAKWGVLIWEKADRIVALNSKLKFVHKDEGEKEIFMPVFLAAMGDYCATYLENSGLGRAR